jgi:hypothetical protein
MLNSPGPIRSIGLSLEAIDIAITVTGTQSKSRRLYPYAMASPIVASCIAGYGATIWRYLEAKFRGVEPECPWYIATLHPLCITS